MVALFLTACGGGGMSLLVTPSENAAMNTDSPDDTSDALTTSRITVQGTSAVDLLDYLKDNASGGAYWPCK